MNIVGVYDYIYHNEKKEKINKKSKTQDEAGCQCLFFSLFPLTIVLLNHDQFGCSIIFILVSTCMIRTLGLSCQLDEFCVCVCVREGKRSGASVHPYNCT